MFRPRPTALAGAASLAAWLACALLVSSCTDELPPVGELSDIGVLEGRVTEGGQPVVTWLRLASRDDLAPRAEFNTRTDSTGWYHLELPIGTYSYFLRTALGEAPHSVFGDTISVGRCVRRRDFARGHVRIVVRVPEVYASAHLRLRMATEYHDTDDLRWVQGDSALFEMPLLPPATYSVQLSVPWTSGDVIIISGDDDGASLDSLRVGSDTITERREDLRARHASLTGRVTGGQYLRADEVRVTAFTATGRARTRTNCSANGDFRLDFLGPQPVRLRAEYRDVDRWFGGTTQQNAPLFDLQPGSALTGIDLEGGAVYVRFAGPGDFVNTGAKVLLRDEAGSDWYPTSYYSRANPLELDLLPAGRLRLCVLGGYAGDPWLPQWYDGAESAAEATYIELAAGQTADLLMNLQTGGTIRGQFVYHDGNAHYWSPNVALHDRDGQRLSPMSVPTYGTAMELPGLPDGTFLLAMYLSSAPWWYPGTYDLAEAVPVTIVDHGTVSGLSWEMPFPYKETGP